MHLGRFHAVIRDLDEYFTSAAVPQQLEKCAGLLDNYKSTQSDSYLQQFRSALDELYQSLKIVNPDLEQPYARQVISDLKLSNLLEPRFSDYIRGAFPNFAFDVAGLAAVLRGTAKEIAPTLANIHAVALGLEKLGVEYERVDESRSEVGFLLPRELVGETLPDLTSELQKLNLLVRAINELTGADHYDSRVATVSSSGWEIFLALDPAQIGIIVIAIERIVNLYKTNLEIKFLQRQLAEKQLPPAITDSIQDHIKKSIESTMEDLTNEIIEQYARINDAGRLNELSVQLKQGFTYLAERLDRGTVIEINVGIPSQGDSEPEDELDGEPLSGATLLSAKKRTAEVLELQARARSASIATTQLAENPPLLLPKPTEETQQDVVGDEDPEPNGSGFPGNDGR